MAQGPVDQQAELRITRRYPVAPEKVWRAWTDPLALSQWFGPGTSPSVTLAEFDVRAGGRYRIRFDGPDGEKHEVGGAYEVVEPHQRLVFSWAWHTTPERVSRVSILLRPVEGGTELDFRHDRFFDQAARDNHSRGWNAAFEKLDAWLASA
jgi:uncharacterized protein YndB with AHSA1/START domain